MDRRLTTIVAADMVRYSRLMAASVQIATNAETLELIEQDELYGTGCGWVNVSLLASCVLTTGCQLWTLDKRLAQQSIRYGIRFQFS